MPTFRASAEFDRSPAVLYDFLLHPANLPRVSPPDVHMRVIEGPERLQLGSRLTIEGRRWGMRQTMTLAIVALEPECLIADEQISGPFRRLHQERRLEPTAAGVRLHVHIDFEPPGGIVGLLLTPNRIQEYLAEMHEYSVRAMRTLLAPAGGR